MDLLLLTARGLYAQVPFMIVLMVTVLSGIDMPMYEAMVAIGIWEMMG
jgi:hypothetical protein